jgi:outer membrane lipoprotein SlyB
MKKLAIVTILAAAACGAIAENPHGLPPGIAKKIMAACDDCATVKEVKKEKRKGEGGAIGIVAGAAAGGLLGNEVQKQVTKKEVWVTKVTLRDGSERRFEQEAEPTWQPGTVVKIKNNTTLAKL